MNCSLQSKGLWQAVLGTIRCPLPALHSPFQPEDIPGSKYPPPPSCLVWLWKSPCEVQLDLPPLPGIWTCWLCSILWPKWNDIILLCRHQSVCLFPLLHSLPVYLHSLSYYPQLGFFSLHQNTSNFFLLLNMSILFSNTLELYISHRAHDFSADCKTEPCYPTCSSPVFSPAPGISISLIFTPTSHPAFGIWLLSS